MIIFAEICPLQETMDKPSEILKSAITYKPSPMNDEDALTDISTGLEFPPSQTITINVELAKLAASPPPTDKITVEGNNIGSATVKITLADGKTTVDDMLPSDTDDSAQTVKLVHEMPVIEVTNVEVTVTPKDTEQKSTLTLGVHACLEAEGIFIFFLVKISVNFSFQYSKPTFSSPNPK